MNERNLLLLLAHGTENQHHIDINPDENNNCRIHNYVIIHLREIDRSLLRGLHWFCVKERHIENAIFKTNDMLK